MFESLWSDELPALATSSITDLKGKEKIERYKQRQQAQELLKSLLPPDEEPDGES